MSSNRIEYIDLAKGICILLVVLFHLFESYPYTCAVTTYGLVFRMPLYYFLSGLFFKTYGGIWDFTKRKINKLLIPFLFWYLLSVVLSSAVYHFTGLKIMGGIHRIEPIPALLQVWNYRQFPNMALWFLLSLFEINIVFYIITIIANKLCRFRVPIIVILSLAGGIFGAWLISNEIRLPLFFHSSLFNLPHFCLGYLVFRNTKLLEPGKKDQYLWLFAVAAFALFAVFAHVFLGLPDRGHRFDTMGHCLLSYIGAWLGIAGIMLLSKSIKKLPIISMYGRYSIMILVTHLLVIGIVETVTKQLGIPTCYCFIINLVLVLSYGIVAIPFLRRFLPHVTAQKDIIKVSD